jgi:hypothetical protein
MRVPSGLFVAFLIVGLRNADAQSAPWLTDDQARDLAGATVHAEFPEPCYSTYRNESLEDSVFSLRRNPIIEDRLNRSVFFYRVASDACSYVVKENGKFVPMVQVTSDCCEYGLVAVDRATAKAYWFSGEKRENRFKDFVRNEQILPDFAEPSLYLSLYRQLVWGQSNDNDIESTQQLRDAVQENFKSAYSPYERDNKWEKKFNHWWRKCRSSIGELKLETTYEKTSEGMKVRGYAFIGFQLTIPSSAPPPKGNPRLIQWTLLVRPDGTVERLPAKTIYSAR